MVLDAFESRSCTGSPSPGAQIDHAFITTDNDIRFKNTYRVNSMLGMPYSRIPRTP